MKRPRRPSLKAAIYVTDAIVAEEFMIPSETPGIDLYVRNKRVAGLTTFRPERTVLFVHGSSYPAETAFDLNYDGLSWLEHVARHGYDAYLVDVRGYGRSTRPPEMERASEASLPVAPTETAVRDVGTAITFILQRRGLNKLDLVGWSWGTTLMGTYTATHNEQVNKLVLLAPQWLRTTPSASDQGGPLGAYRVITRDAAKERWLNGVPEERRQIFLPDAWFNAWADQTFALDPWGAGQRPQRIRAPNGTVQDTRNHWSVGRPTYDPGEIKVPVLIVHASNDQELPFDMAAAYFRLLTGAPYKRWVEIGGGTHSFILETNRWQVLDAVQAFLDEE